MTKLTKDQIDNYHSGRMNESEMADFENMLESDPALKAESDFQSDIVSGLKEYRKMELKSRLDGINVGPTWIEFAQQSALMKSLGGVMVASIIGTGIYFYGERPDVATSDVPATVLAQETESIEFVWQLGEEEAQVTQSLEKPNTQVIDAREDVDKAEVIEETATPALNEEVAEAVKSEEKAKVFKPSFEAPGAEDVDEDTDFSTTGLDEIPNSTTATSEQPVDVQTEISKSTVIKFKYYDGKLFLKGDFDKAPYEILEINSAEGRRIYVYYLGSYYKVGLADKLTELPKVSNADVLGELKLLRENK